MEDDPRHDDRDVGLGVSRSWILREEADGDALLFDADTGAVWVANRTAVEVWRLAEPGTTLRAMVAALRARYEGFDDAAERDVVKLVDELTTAGALTVSG